MRLKLYRAKEWYTDELRKINPQGVTTNNPQHLNTYLGVLVKINGFDYIAPFTHATKTNKWHQQPIIVKNSNGDVTNKLGTILFHNMIPVYEGVYEEVDVDSYKISDPKKYYLYLEQLIWVNTTENKLSILNKAQNTYNIHFDTTHPDYNFLTKTLHCNFKDLEARAKELQQSI